MRNIVLCLMLVLAAAAGAEAATGRQRIGIAAVVNDEVITFSDLANRAQLYVSSAPQKPPAEAFRKLEQQVLNRLIDEKLQMQEARSLGIEIADEQVTAGFAEIARQNGFSADEFKRRLVEAGVKPQTLYDQLRAEIAWSHVVKRKLRPQINVSESEIDNEMDQMSRASGKPEYRVAEIFLSVPEGANETEVRENAAKVVAQISKGASFAQIAREVSQSPGASTGGDIGWIQQGQLDAALDAALAKMQPGQVSPPIRSAKGFHILFLRDARRGEPVAAQAPAANAPPAEAPEGQGETFLRLKQIVIPVGKSDPQAIVNAKIIRARSLKAEIASCETMEQKAKDFIFDGTGDLGRVAESALPAEIREAVSALPAGTLSEPVRIAGGIAVLMVCAREETQSVAAAPAEAGPKVPPPEARPVAKGDEASREKVANKIGQQRLSQMQERYLRDLRATAFIDKRI